MPPRELVLLDLDGTLVDSAPGILACLHHALDALGLVPPADADLRRAVGPPLSATFPALGVPAELVPLAIERYRERYHAVGMFECDLYPGVADLLDRLGAARTLAVATSKPTYSAGRILAHFGLAERFAFVGGADFDGVRHDKAAVIEHTLAELADRGVVVATDATVMVGDREHDVIGARRHGIDTVGVLWGYGTAAELASAGAIALADTPADLPDILSGNG